jgi:hypothetical protein
MANPFRVVGSKPTLVSLRSLSNSHHGIFLCRLHNDVPGLWYCRSCRRFGPARPFLPAFRASLRTRRSRPSVGNGGRRYSICRIRQADAAIALPCAPSTSCLRNSCDCPEQGGSRDPVQQEEADQSAPIPRPSNQSARPKLPPKASLESKPDSAVNLCPRALALWCVTAKNGYPARTQPLRLRVPLGTRGLFVFIGPARFSAGARYLGPADRPKPTMSGTAAYCLAAGTLSKGSAASRSSTTSSSHSLDWIAQPAAKP